MNAALSVAIAMIRVADHRDFEQLNIDFADALQGPGRGFFRPKYQATNRRLIERASDLNTRKRHAAIMPALADFGQNKTTPKSGLVPRRGLDTLRVCVVFIDFNGVLIFQYRLIYPQTAHIG